MRLRLPDLARLLTAAGPPPATAVAPSQDERPPEEHIKLALSFMAEAGAAMNSAGDPTTFVRRSLSRIGRAYGLSDVEVFALPTLLLVRYGAENTAFVDLSARVPQELQLDQLIDLHRLVEEAESGRVDLGEGLRRLRKVEASGPRLSLIARVAGAGLTAAGISLVLDPSLEEVLVCAVLGGLAGLIELGASRWSHFWPLAPATSGFIVGSLAYFLVEQGLDSPGLRTIVPPLATFLPGAALTVSMLELANGDIVAGTSRLGYGFVRLLLLVFGVVIAAQWVGVPAPEAAPETLPYGTLAVVLGVLLFTAGVCIHYSAPRAAFVWLLAVVAAAAIGEVAGGLFFDGHLSGLFGGLAMVLAARMVQGRAGAPPLFACLTPAFWLLVPGVVGLEGLTDLAQDNPVSGLDDLLAMLLAMVSIALGVLLGLLVSGSPHVHESV